MLRCKPTPKLKKERKKAKSLCYKQNWAWCGWYWFDPFWCENPQQNVFVKELKWWSAKVSSSIRINVLQHLLHVYTQLPNDGAVFLLNAMWAIQQRALELTHSSFQLDRGKTKFDTHKNIVSCDSSGSFIIDCCEFCCCCCGCCRTMRKQFVCLLLAAMQEFF